MEYFAQDEAARLNPDLTVYETLVKGSPEHMVPAICNILGGFLFSGDDIYKRVAVLSGGERTRLAVARMLLRPSNTLLLDEPTNHLELDALVDYGGTLIFVSHDRYFIDRLATKTVEIGGGEGVLHLGSYEELLWRKAQVAAATAGTAATSSGPVRRNGQAKANGRPEAMARQGIPTPSQPATPADTQKDREERKRAAADAKRAQRERRALDARIADLEARIAEREQAIRQIEASMATPGFYEDRDAANAVISRHQALMWEVGDLMHQWEELQTGAADR
jgi:ATP-binding cassette subfamily F protein 3